MTLIREDGDLAPRPTQRDFTVPCRVGKVGVVVVAGVQVALYGGG